MATRILWRSVTRSLVLALGVVLLAGCGSGSDEGAVIDPGDGGNYAPVIDPA